MAASFPVLNLTIELLIESISSKQNWLVNPQTSHFSLFLKRKPALQRSMEILLTLF